MSNIGLFQPRVNNLLHSLRLYCLITGPDRKTRNWDYLFWSANKCAVLSRGLRLWSGHARPRGRPQVWSTPKKWRWVPNVVERCVVGERVKPLLMRDNRAGLAPWKSFRVCRAQEVTHDPAGKVWSFFSDNLVAGGCKHSIMAPAGMCCQCGGHYQTPLSLCHYILWHCHY